MPRSRARLRRALAFVALVAVVALLVLAPSRRPWVLNASPSMPLGIYEIDPVDRPVVAGDLISICPAASEAALALARGYVGAGACPSGTAPILKYVAAAGGETVETAADHVAISRAGDAARCLHPGVTLALDGKGRALPHPPFGRFDLRAGQLWLWAPQGGSFDSRYFGPAEASATQGFARAILVTHPEMLHVATVACAPNAAKP